MTLDNLVSDPTWWVLIASGAVALSVAIIVISVGSRFVGQEKRRRRQYLLDITQGPDELGGTRSLSLRVRLEQIIMKALHVVRLDRPLQRALAGSDVQMSEGRYAGWVLGILGATWLMLTWLSGSWVAGGVLALLLVPLGSVVYLNYRGSRTRRQFEEELPEFLLLMSSALRTGLSFTQAMDSVSSEGTGEVERQIRRAVSEINMGATPDEALDRVATRMRSADMHWAVIAIGIQREVGGNLSNILDSVADTVRARESVRQEVRSLSAEGRLSALVLAALPVVLFAILAVISPQYVSVLWTTTIGIVLLVVSGALMIAGALWMAALIKVKA